MNALFETDGVSAKRKETGSKISVNQTPREFLEFSLFYENPIYELKIAIVAVFIYETMALEQKHYGRIIQQPVKTAVILEKGRLKATLQQKFGPSVPYSLADGLVCDAYELILEWLNTDLTRYYHFDKSKVPAHVYEAEIPQFHGALRGIPDNIKPGPEIISKLQAKVVF